MYRGHSGSTTRSHNRALLLRLLLLHEPVSRIELASITGLTVPTVHGLTRELMQEGIVEELGTAEPQGGGAGRKAALLGLSPYSRVSIGVDLGVRTTRIGLLDLKGNILSEAQVIRYGTDETPEDTLKKIFVAVEKMVSDSALSMETIVGLGIGVPGLVEVTSGTIRRCPNLGWHGIPIAAWFQERLGMPVIIDNNIRAMAIGERLFGQGREEANLISFFVGPGIGAGVLINDELFRGVNDGAGEVGHTLIDPQGPMCSCGRRGCLEAVASNTAIVRRLWEAVQDGTDLKLRSLVFKKLSQEKTGELAIEDVISWAEDGNRYCLMLLEQAGRVLGEGIANLVNLFNPGLVIVGGELFNHGDLVFNILAATAREKAFSVPAESLAIVKTRFGKRQGLVGAGALALNEFFYSSTISQTLIDYS